jgi:hypothetical protein
MLSLRASHVLKWKRLDSLVTRVRTSYSQPCSSVDSSVSHFVKTFFSAVHNANDVLSTDREFHSFSLGTFFLEQGRDWFLPARSPQYNITDERKALNDCIADWVSGLGGKEFMGGADPNLADLAVFGTLRAVEVRISTMKNASLTIMILLNDPPFPFRPLLKKVLLGSEIRMDLRGPQALSLRGHWREVLKTWIPVSVRRVRRHTRW